MHITPLNLNFTSSNLFGFHYPETNDNQDSYDTPETQASSLDALASYNKAGLDSTLPKLDIDTLDDRSITEEFEDVELEPVDNYSYSAVMDYSGTQSSKPIRRLVENSPIKDQYPQYLEDYVQAIKNNGNEIPQYKINENLSYEEDQMLKNLANAAINIRTLIPTINEHTLYRVVTEDVEALVHGKQPDEYVEQMKSLKEGDEIMIDPCPMHTSTSARQTMQNYGSGQGKKVLFKIKVPQGSQVRPIGKTDPINRVMVGPFSKFRVLENEEYQNDTNIITLEYIKPEE